MQEESVLCSSGYTANAGLNQSFAAKGTPLYLDMKAHILLHEEVVSAVPRQSHFGTMILNRSIARSV
jgi:CAI-1 autoinducer synthase